MTRLRILLSGQAARLTALSGDSRKKELHQQMSKELNASLTGLEHDLSKLMVERDMTLAEVEELSASKRSVIRTLKIRQLLTVYCVPVLRMVMFRPQNWAGL